MLCHIEDDGETNATFIFYKKLIQFKKIKKLVGKKKLQKRSLLAEKLNYYSSRLKMLHAIMHGC